MLTTFTPSWLVCLVHKSTSGHPFSTDTSTVSGCLLQSVSKDMFNNTTSLFHRGCPAAVVLFREEIYIVTIYHHKRIVR
ncbi:hypothetical protein SERLA73DRAFT_185994 [Serpula lacrymans var. lacrymans S7.3]|uniref:Uncharacterized protein n=1 Tax=Serpula lacrymans var. lacrymans (strain S7.3) TaxID=936435 RepID=F8Q6R8_SERL3|nr:hypothetical protein SERLA73DRAFT_185994 [Serpula lacrymans var. lacrymans S7.3]